MSWTGLWAAGPITAADARDLYQAVGDPCPAAAHRERGGGPGGSSAPGRPIPLLAEQAAAGHRPAGVCDDVVEALGRADEPPFTSAARKADPAMALCHALGPGGPVLPVGCFGQFVLLPDQVEEAAQRIRRAVGAEPTAWRTRVDQIKAWMQAAGDEPGFDAEALLDGCLSALERAAKSGGGAAGGALRY